MASSDDRESMAARGEPTGPYNMQRPTLDDARTALRRLYGANADGVWTTLLAGAGLTGHETDQASFDRLVDRMKAADSVTKLCARSLAIRSATFTRLSAAHTLISDAR